MINNDPLFLVIDLFCGAGGTTTGFALAELDGIGIAKVIACVNHDPKAIKSHWRNHPEVKHFEEDIRTLDLTDLLKTVSYYRKKYPNAYVSLWASLECTNFSKAKGGQPRDADSRTLANDLERYIVALNPDYIQIENVVEFMSWGPLDENGKPVSRKNGQDWLKWREMIKGHGYYDAWTELNSANYGAYTSRNRLFGIFARPELPITWPETTHAKNPNNFSLHGDMKPWNPVKHCLDFADEGDSIFNRKKDLSDKTLERIYAGLLKYVAKGDKAFISKYFSGKPKSKVNSVDQPCPTITTFGGSTLVQTIHCSDLPITKPLGSITTKDHHALVTARPFLLKYNSMTQDGKHTPPSVDDPAPVVPAQARLGLISPQFLTGYYGKGDNLSGIEDPCPTIPTKDRFGFVQPIHFIMPTNFNNIPRSIEEPAPTITADRHHTYIVNPSHGGHTTSTDAPCPVIIARQDKAPLSLVIAEKGVVAVPVYDTDSEIMVKIKEFMAIYGLVDIKMRMLRVHELLKIQGFPAGYELEGNQSDQKKFIGNSVVPQVVKAWTEAMALRLIENKKTQVA